LLDHNACGRIQSWEATYQSVIDSCQKQPVFAFFKAVAVALAGYMRAAESGSYLASF